ncbi:MAG: stage II sporulation protein R [Clostridia bacterium]|nr:stage II sporulation protein R [Clostridia bacterium]
MIGILVFVGITSNSNNSEILRIHIRANSNSEIDQNVKYQVKDAVVSVMLPLLCECQTKEQAEEAIKSNFDLIENTANNILKQNGFSYTSKAKLKNEEFPTRSYAGEIYEAGFYDALILELGKAEGDNWWCVVYPPLCFLQSNNPKDVKYTSKLVNFVKKLFGE